MGSTKKVMSSVHTSALQRRVQETENEVETVQVVLCPVFLTSQEERQFDKAALKHADNRERLALDVF